MVNSHCLSRTNMLANPKSTLYTAHTWTVWSKETPSIHGIGTGVCLIFKYLNTFKYWHLNKPRQQLALDFGLPRGNNGRMLVMSTT